MLDPEKIYKEYSKTVFRYLYAKTGDSHISEEITQETFTRRSAESVALTVHAKSPLGSAP